MLTVLCIVLLSGTDLMQSAPLDARPQGRIPAPAGIDRQRQSIAGNVRETSGSQGIPVTVAAAVDST